MISCYPTERRRLTQKESKFAYLLVMHNLSYSEAYKKAGYAFNGEESAASAAHTAKNRPHVKAYINELMEIRQENLRMSKCWAMEVLKKIVEAENSTNREKIAAIAEYNKMAGFYSPIQASTNIEGGMRIVELQVPTNKRVNIIDVKKEEEDEDNVDSENVQ